MRKPQGHGLFQNMRSRSYSAKKTVLPPGIFKAQKQQQKIDANENTACDQLIDAYVGEYQHVATIHGSSHSTLTAESALPKPGDFATKVTVSSHHRRFCRLIDDSQAGSMWIHSVLAVNDYTTMQIRYGHSTELRLSIVGITAGASQSAYLFDCESGKILNTIMCKNIITCMSLSRPEPNSNASPLLALGHKSGKVELFELWNGVNIYGATIGQIRHPSGSISKVCICDDFRAGQLLLLAAAGQKLCVTNMERNRPVAEVDVLGNITSVSVRICPHDSVAPLDTSLRNTDYLLSTLVALTDTKGYLYVYDVNQQFRLVRTVRAHFDGSCNASAFYSWSVDNITWVVTAGADAAIRIWDPCFDWPGSNPGQQLEVGDLLGHCAPINAIAIIEHFDRPGLASASLDGEIRIWDLASRALLASIPEAHVGSIRSLACTAFPNLMLVTGGNDGVTKIWDLDRAEQPAVSNVTSALGQNSRLPLEQRFRTTKKYEGNSDEDR